MPHAGVALIDPRVIFDKVGLARGMRVADLGCGRTGHFVFPAAKVVGDTGVVYAVDIMKDVLENIRNRVRSEGYDNVQTVWSDVESVGKTSIPINSLDGCFIVNVFFMVKNKAAVIREAARILKSGGFLSIVEWAKKLGPLGPAEGSMVPPETLIAAAKENQLALVENFPAGDYHYCLIFKKV